MEKKEKIPSHVAIIMDGNGRWAKSRNLPKLMGHREGVKAAERAIQSAKNAGVKVLTLYTFSTENWKRPKEEVDALMSLLGAYLDKETARLSREGIKLNVIGDIATLPDSVSARIKKSMDATAHNDILTLNLAINYGSRQEILNAVRSIARRVAEGAIAPETISEDTVSSALYTAGLPDPDLLIRTSGELRVSNFLLWQISYAELYVTDVLWPDFSENDFKAALNEYVKRERRYGGR